MPIRLWKKGFNLGQRRPDHRTKCMGGGGGGGGGGVMDLFGRDCFWEAPGVQKDEAGPHPDSQKGAGAYTGAQFQQNHKI